jgi:hypothetical protein
MLNVFCLKTLAEIMLLPSMLSFLIYRELEKPRKVPFCGWNIKSRPNTPSYIRFFVGLSAFLLFFNAMFRFLLLYLLYYYTVLLGFGRATRPCAAHNRLFRVLIARPPPHAHRIFAVLLINNWQQWEVFVLTRWESNSGARVEVCILPLDQRDW